MNRVLRNKVSVLISVGLIAMLSACGNSGSSGGGTASIGDGSDIDSSVTDTGGTDTESPIVTIGSATIVPNDFSFPQVAEANEGFEVIIPEGPKPAFPARRTLSAGTGDAIEFGDPVVLKYSMYSWSTGALVESTDDFDEAFTIRAGLSDGVPEYLSNSLLGRQVGDRLQIVFNEGMEDLPEYLDNTDAYVLVLDLI